ncbi:MAG: GWxTD domain-containing protein [bacterium]
MNDISRLFTFLSLCLVINVAPLLPQKQDDLKYTFADQNQPGDAPNYEAQLFTSIAEFKGLSRLNVEVSFNNFELQFIRTKDKKFRADFEVTLTIFDEDSSEVDQVKWKDFVKAENFNSTTSKEIVHTTRGFIELEPATYLFHIAFKDLETRRAGYRNGTVTLRAFDAKRLSMSGIWFVDSLSTDQTLSVQDPDSSNRERLFAFFDIYLSGEADSLKLSYEFLDEKDQTSAAPNTQWLDIVGQRVVRYHIEIPENVQGEDPYHIKIVMTTKKDTVAHKQLIKSTYLKQKPTFTNLNDAIEKLFYIANRNELKEIKKATPEEQQAWFREFWKKRDPTPETEVNEYMTEYYSRILRANRLFRNESKDAGWRTEMGRVYVMLGPPDNIQKFDRYDSRYMDATYGTRVTFVWYYYDIRRRVIFDYRGLRYRLANYHEIFDLLNGEMSF